MINEEKQLLLKDLCARLPYKVKFMYFGKEVLPDNGSFTIYGIHGDYIFTDYSIGILLNEIKSYLRPMSSMTQEEVKELVSLGKTSFCTLEPGGFREIANPKQIDWLNAHHFDYRGLIEKGLALEAPEGMYKSN